MDFRLRDKLSKLDEHISKLFHIEHDYLQLEGSKKGLLASLTIKALGKSHAEKETYALASQDWKDLIVGIALKEAEYNRDKRRLELLFKAFDAEYSSMKIEAQAIRKQI